MRILKTFYLTILFSLAMGLFCGELPESLRLRDDTSNDYVTDSHRAVSREMEATREENGTEQRLTIRQTPAIPSRATNYAASAGPSLRSGQEILQLLSIRRT